MKLASAKRNLTFALEDSFSHLKMITHVESCEGFENRILAKVSPQNIHECLQLLKISQEFHVPIYPVSAGKNWGFGASIPTANDCLLVDLSSMKNISNYDANLGTLKIQAGVTQKELYDFLEKTKSPFRIDVTGSGEETSVLGNALERGLGYQALRHEHILSMKVLLMDGSIIETGYGRFENTELNKCLSYGLGPSLNHLFTQSNFGIVLEATIKLLKRCEYECAFSFSIQKEEDLAKVSLLIQDFFDNALITSIPKVFDKRRCEVTFCPKYFASAKAKGMKPTRKEVLENFEKSWGEKTWTFVTSLGGPYEVVQSKLKYIRERLKDISPVRVVDRKSLENSMPQNFEEELQKQFDELILGYLQGKPSNDALLSTYWDILDYEKSPERPEEKKDYAFLYITPLIPNTGADLNKYLEIYEKVNERFSQNPAMTLNFLNRNSVEAVISLSFNKKNPFEIKRAHNFKKTLLSELAQAGYLPYRLDTGEMQNFTWDEVSQKIKVLLDPENLLAPGRYSKR